MSFKRRTKVNKAGTKSNQLKTPSAIFLAIDLLACALLAIVLLFAHGKLLNMYRDLEVNTANLSTNAKILMSTHPVAYFISFLAIGAILYTKEKAIKEKFVTLIINIISGICILIFVSIYLPTMLSPLFQIVK